MKTYRSAGNSSHSEEMTQSYAEESVPLFVSPNDAVNQTYNTCLNDDGFDTTSLNDAPLSLYHEAKNLVHVALPTIMVQLSTFFIYPQCASAVGRNLDTESLAAFSLGSLSGNMTCVSIIIGTLSATETLQPRAFGLKRYREVGLLAIRGFLMCLLSLLLPIIFLLSTSDKIFNLLGQDVGAGHLASQWIQTYIWSVPPLLLFRVIQRFLACQNIVMPCVFGSAIGCFFIHPFVLKWAMREFGFIGSSWAIVITQTAQLLLCIGFVSFTGAYERSTWSGLNIQILRDAVNLREMFNFAKLSIGGIFSLSEWWFWECICFMAGRFGLIELCVHTVSYQLIPVLFMIPLGISIGLSVRMGVLLPTNVLGAKHLAACTMVFTTFLGIIVSGVIYTYQTQIVSLFTEDEAVFCGCEKIWFRLCVYNVLLWIFCISRGILSALGLQWKTAMNMFIVLWCWTIPAIIHSCITNKRGYYHMWEMLPLSYIVLNVGLTFTYATADWENIASKIRLDKNMKGAEEELVA